MKFYYAIFLKLFFLPFFVYWLWNVKWEFWQMCFPLPNRFICTMKIKSGEEAFDAQRIMRRNMKYGNTGYVEYYKNQPFIWLGKNQKEVEMHVKSPWKLITCLQMIRLLWNYCTEKKSSEWADQLFFCLPMDVECLWSSLKAYEIFEPGANQLNLPITCPIIIIEWKANSKHECTQ